MCESGRTWPVQFVILFFVYELFVTMMVIIETFYDYQSSLLNLWFIVNKFRSYIGFNYLLIFCQRIPEFKPFNTMAEGKFWSGK